LNAHNNYKLICMEIIIMLNANVHTISAQVFITTSQLSAVIEAYGFILILKTLV
jgi:hypothetical protein